MQVLLCVEIVISMITNGLRDNGSNLAAFLYSMMQNDETNFRLIEGVVSSIAPYFKCFKLRPDVNDNERIRLEWGRKGD